MARLVILIPFIFIYLIASGLIFIHTGTELDSLLLSLSLWPGLVCLFPFILSNIFNKYEKWKWTTVLLLFVSVISFNFWPLATGNNEIVLSFQFGILFIFISAGCSGAKFARKCFFIFGISGLMISIAGLTCQFYLQAEFANSNICLSDEGVSCGSSCYRNFSAIRCDNREYIQDFFLGHEYVAYWYGRKDGYPTINFKSNALWGKYQLRERGLAVIELHEY